jgi:hypothetical protein
MSGKMPAVISAGENGTAVSFLLSEFCFTNDELEL